MGLNIDGRRLSHLRFADDIVLFANTPEELTKMITELAAESEKVGLKINPEKTKLMTNGEERTIKIGLTRVDYAQEFIYLGQLMAPYDNTNKEIERRISNGWRRYWSMKEVMKDKTLHIATKSKLFNTCILPILMYGCQTWSMSQKHTNKLVTCQRAMERSMLGVRKSDKLKSSSIRTKTKVVDIIQNIRRFKWRWAGHMIRGKQKWCKIVTEWYPREGQRRRGRPQKRWDDDICQVAGKTWYRVARDRQEWKRLEEAFAEGQSDLQRKSKMQIMEFN